MPDLGEQLRECFLGRVCLMGLGNPEFGDDGLGGILSNAIAGRFKEQGYATHRHEAINAQTTPERFISSVSARGFNHLIFADAVEFGGAPGSVIFLGSEEMASRFPQISTHRISPGLLARWVEAGGKTRAWLLGVQPGSLKPAKGLTRGVQTTVDMLEDLICGLWVSES
jgi:hydrogenase maturation protease